MEEYVVLVDENNIPIGTAEKLDVHHHATPLHRGFSLFVFNHKGEILLQQRSKYKKTWPLIWSNTCCGHPQLEETSIAAARRRLKHELGITHTKIFEILPQYRYQFEHEGIIENEFCPVMIGFTTQQPLQNPKEVASTLWMPWNKFIELLHMHPERYSEWCVEEALLLDANSEFHELYKKYTK